MDASAGEGVVSGDAMAGLGDEKKPMKDARAIAGMAGGAGEFSYARNSVMQSQSVNVLKPILEQEIEELELFKDWSGRGSAIRLADFGCSVGANTLRYAEICSQSVRRVRSSKGRNLPEEVQYFFCDLPSNDFNTLFLQLEDWRKSRSIREDFHVAAVPGSFYRRLFPRGSLPVAISVFSVHWMSQVPDLVMDKSSPAFNKGRVWIDRTTNSAALQAYTQAARQDLRQYFLCRADEVVPGGLVLIYAPGRADGRHPELQWPKEAEYAGSVSSLFETTWEELVTEGIIQEERRDTFNVPIYYHSVNDVRMAVESTNAFEIKRLEIKHQAYFTPNEMEHILSHPEAYSQFIKKFIQSQMNSFVEEHIGKLNSQKLFERLEKNATRVARERKVSNLSADCVLVVLMRK